MRSIASLKFTKIDLVAFDFDGVFTDNFVYVSEEGLESVRCSRFDGIGISYLKSINIHSMIISTEINNVVQKRAKKLAIECHNGVKDKRQFLETYCLENNFDIANTVFVGNDINDLEVLKIVGYPILVKDHHKSLANYNFYTLTHYGGSGAVRELCEKILLDMNHG